MNRQQIERGVMISREWEARRADDPWWNWKPTEKQIPFINSIYLGETTEAWFIAANRSGKSEASAYLGAGLARFGRQNPKYQISMGGAIMVEDYATAGWVISVDFPNSRDVIQPKYFNNGQMVGMTKPFIPEREISKWSQTDQILYLKNGSIIGFKSADAKAIKFAGASRDWIHIDEECPKTVYNEATIRIGCGRSVLVFGACTILPPEGQIGGVSWIYEDKIKPFQTNPDAQNFKLFGSSIYDNPHLLQSEIERLESRYPVGSVERKIRLEGEYLPGLQGARAYPAFDSKLHVRPQGMFSQRRPLIWTHDFNVEPMCSLVCQRDGDIWRVYKELIIDTDASIEEMCNYFRETVPVHHGELWIYGDATGKARHPQTGRTEYQLLLNQMRTYGSPVRLKVPDSNPLVPDRVNAVQTALRDEKGVPHIEMDPSCKELIDDMEQVLRDHRGGIKKTHDRRDPYARRTHASDALGYLITFDRPVKLHREGQGSAVTTIKQAQYSHGRR